MKLATNNELMLQYLTWCKKEKKFSDATVTTYMSSISAFIQFLQPIGIHFSKVTHEEAQNYLSILVDRHNKKKNITKISINNYRTVLKTFFAWLVKEKVSQENPYTETSRLKQEKPARDQLTIAQIKKLIDDVNNDGTFLFRDTVMFELFWNSGLRTSELSHVELTHMNYTKVFNEKLKRDMWIYEIKVVEGKGGKDRWVAVGEATTYVIRKYLTGRKLRYPVSEYLFPNNQGGHMNRRQIYEIIKGFLKLTQTKKKGAHVLRHTYATMLLNNGVNLLAVKKMLGHSSAKTTQIYAKPSMEMMEREFNKAHPKGDRSKANKKVKVIPVISNYVMEKESHVGRPRKSMVGEK